MSHPATTPLRPFNVLYLHSHDTGRMIEPYGYAVRSPNLARFARDAVVFRQAFTVSPTCSPSRCALLTGQYAHRCGMLGLAHRGFKMPDYSLHLARVLRNAGYLTALAGVEHEACDQSIISCSYEELLNEMASGLPGGHVERDQAVARRAADFLRRSHDRPFFLSVGFFATHRKFPDAGDHSDGHIRPFPGIVDTSQTRRDLADYQASLDVLDNGVGTVLRALGDSGRENDTLVICTTDHGPAFPFMKGTMHDDGLGVFLMLRLPGPGGAGRYVDAMVTHLDIVPTLMEFLGMERRHSLDGVSCLPLLRGEKSFLHESIFAETNFHACYMPQRAVRTIRWKFIRNEIEGPTPLVNIDDSPTKKFLYEAGVIGCPEDREQLYDLVADPGERHNLAGDERCSTTLRSLRKQLDDWMRETEDPLNAGPVQPPPEALLTPKSDYSPAGGFPDDIARCPAAP